MALFEAPSCILARWGLCSTGARGAALGAHWVPPTPLCRPCTPARPLRAPAPDALLPRNLRFWHRQGHTIFATGADRPMEWPAVLRPPAAINLDQQAGPPCDPLYPAPHPHPLLRSLPLPLRFWRTASSARKPAQGPRRRKKGASQFGGRAPTDIRGGGHLRRDSLPPTWGEELPRTRGGGGTPEADAAAADESGGMGSLGNGHGGAALPSSGRQGAPRPPPAAAPPPPHLCHRQAPPPRSWRGPPSPPPSPPPLGS